MDECSRDYCEMTNLIRKSAQESTGSNCTFVDDDLSILAGLAQRAILAGLHSEFDRAMAERMTEAAEKYREGHEKELGYCIAPANGEQ